MNSLDIYKNQKDFLNIKLKSEAFDEGEPFFYKDKPNDYYQEICEIHKVLYRLDKNKPLSINITYEAITEDYLDELVELHKEWFPFLYDRDYFKKYVLRPKCVAIGAFLKIGLKVYLIGCALGEIVSEDKFKHTLPGILVERSWYDFFSSYVDCGYLHSLGVIDEYRNLSVGTRLLDLFIEDMKKKSAVVLYLNIIIHNNAAVKFIEANNWHYFGNEKNHYKYRDNLYDSKIYYYILDMNWCNVKDSPKKEGENNSGIEELSSNQRGCWETIFGGFWGGGSTPNKKESNNDEIKTTDNNNV